MSFTRSCSQERLCGVEGNAPSHAWVSAANRGVARCGIIECELFSGTCRRFGLATVQFAVVGVERTVTVFNNGLGCTLDVQRVGKPRGWKSRRIAA